MFIGEYHHSIDEKGRLTIPAKVRNDLGASFIVTRGLDKCLYIYPENEWNNIVDKYRELPNTRDARNFMRFFLSGASESELDKQGRVNITNPLIEYAGLTKDCVIIGVNERLEVWDQDAWNKFIDNNIDDLSDIADSLFGNKL